MLSGRELQRRLAPRFGGTHLVRVIPSDRVHVAGAHAQYEVIAVLIGRDDEVGGHFGVGGGSERLDYDGVQADPYRPPNAIAQDHAVLVRVFSLAEAQFGGTERR